MYPDPLTGGEAARGAGRGRRRRAGSGRAPAAAGWPRKRAEARRATARPHTIFISKWVACPPRS